jgi:hypothetical protein
MILDEALSLAGFLTLHQEIFQASSSAPILHSDASSCRRVQLLPPFLAQAAGHSCDIERVRLRPTQLGEAKRPQLGDWREFIATAARVKILETENVGSISCAGTVSPGPGRVDELLATVARIIGRVVVNSALDECSRKDEFNPRSKRAVIVHDRHRRNLRIQPKSAFRVHRSRSRAEQIPFR